MSGRTRRSVRRCGFCRQEGHDRRTCPCPEMVEYRRVQEERRIERIRLERERIEAARRAAEEREQQNKLNLTLKNMTDYSVYVYFKKEGTQLFTQATNIGGMVPFSQTSLTVTPTYTLRFYHKDEIDGAVDLDTNGRMPAEFENAFFLAGEINLQNIQTNTHEYSINKPYDGWLNDDPVQISITLLNSWKECALKSHYLLKQMERLGAGKNPNLEPLVDMIQDISVPEHSVVDKERAGIPSEITNSY